jgi:tetratricopeptide (TPR) repeat protein
VAFYLSCAGALFGQQSGGNPADPSAPPELLQEARELANAAKLAEAGAAYRKWLDENPASPDYASVLIEAADAGLSADQALDLLRLYSSRVQDPGQREMCRRYQVDLLELLGRTEQALSLLRSFPEKPHWLYRQAQLLYQQGLREEAQSLLQRALTLLGVGEASAAGVRQEEARESDKGQEDVGGGQREQEARIYALLARTYAADGRSSEAESLFRLLKKNYASTSVAPAVLLAYHEFLRDAGREGEADELLRELEARFPDSPEYSLASGQAAGAGISYAPSPVRLLPVDPAQSQQSQPAQPSPAVQPQDRPGDSTVDGQEDGQQDGPQGEEREPAPKAVLVQTGSFCDPENAHYMVRDLKERGFDARIVEKEINGTLYYRVVIGSPQSVENAQLMLLRLKEATFEGVLLFPE